MSCGGFKMRSRNRRGQQSRSLRNASKSCQTVSEFLQQGTLARGSVVIVDEAGQIGVKQMHALLALARENGARIILSGDTRQHGPVEASDALLAIERYAGIRPAGLNSIPRQEPARGKTMREKDAIAVYRSAVKAASEGDFAGSFEKLDILGEIVTVAKVEASGALTLEDGRIIPPTFRQFTRGYAVTSYGSQGKTVEHVLFSDSANRAATNAKQYYFTISRSRKSIRIFTTDKAQLAANIIRTGNSTLALDVFERPSHNRVREQLLRGVKLGREFARRVCMAIATRWAPATKRAERKSISPLITATQPNRPRQP